MEAGVESLPLRFLVAAIVVGITAPTILVGLSAYEVEQFSVRIAAAVDAVVRLAQRMYVTGGGSQAVRVELGGGITASLEYVAFGDAPGGPLATTVRYRLVGHGEVFLLTAPAVPMTGGGGPFVLGPGTHVVHVSYEGEGPVRLGAG